VSARLGQHLPRGWADFLFQLGLWLGFALIYQLARGFADRSPVEAFHNGRVVIDTERALHALVEIDVQRVVVHAGDATLAAVNWTYWLAQFPVLGLGLLWIYLRRNESFVAVRNWVLCTNLLALVGYVLLPTAPPRMFPDVGFTDTLAVAASVNHGSAFVELASNPFAAMPSVHAADALIIGFALAALVRSRWLSLLWTLWPTWVWFSVMATGNHFWLDIAAGVGIAFLAGTVVSWAQSGRVAASPALYPTERCC
jgi:membrane-associated phospholipid phosphatase